MWDMQCICGIANTLSYIRDLNSNMLCTIDSISTQTCTNSDLLYNIYATLATKNPMSVAAEYPTESTDKVTYSTNKVRFLDMLNPKLTVLFKGTYDSELPVYFKDTSGYEHIVTFGDESSPAKASELVNNKPYSALYIGNYIILNPTEDIENEYV